MSSYWTGSTGGAPCLGSCKRSLITSRLRRYIGIRVEVTSSRISSSPSKHSSTSPKQSMEDHAQPPNTMSTTSPTSLTKAPKRKWFTSSSFWPRPTAKSTISESSASSPRESSEMSVSIQEDDSTSEEDFPLLTSNVMSLPRRSISTPTSNRQ